MYINQSHCGVMGQQSGQALWKNWIAGNGWCIFIFWKMWWNCCTSLLWLLN